MAFILFNLFIAIYAYLELRFLLSSLNHLTFVGLGLYNAINWFANLSSFASLFTHFHPSDNFASEPEGQMTHWYHQKAPDFMCFFLVGICIWNMKQHDGFSGD